MIFRAPSENISGAQVKALNTSIMIAVPRAALAPGSRLSQLIRMVSPLMVIYFFCRRIKSVGSRFRI
jgi:hypothetical protein